MQGFDNWLTDVERLAREEYGWAEEAVQSIDRQTWRNYWLDGMSARDALHEEFGAATR